MERATNHPSDQGTQEGCRLEFKIRQAVEAADQKRRPSSDIPVIVAERETEAVGETHGDPSCAHAALDTCEKMRTQAKTGQVAECQFKCTM